MSHNIMKLNTNSFDVNSNRTESISALKYGFIQDDITSPNATVAYPRALAVNDNALIYKGTVNNLFSTSDVEFNDWPTNTNFIESVTLKTNGKYLIQAYFFMIRLNATYNQNQKYILWDGSSYISNASCSLGTVESYATDRNMYSTVEVTGGVSKTISIRIDGVNSAAYDLSAQRMLNHLYVERVL